MRPEFADGAVRLVWDLHIALVLGIALLFLLVSGWVSLRYLRVAPVFPHKREAIWGATWLGPIAVLWVAVGFASAYFGAGMTRYPMTVFIIVLLTFDFGIWAMIFLPSRQGFGWFAWGTVVGAAMRREPLNWECEVAEDERRHRTWWYWGIALWVLLCTWGLPAYLIFPHVLASEVWLDAFRQQELTAQRLQARIALDYVESVHVIGPRVIQRLPRCEQPVVYVELKASASEKVCTQVLSRVQQAMDEMTFEGDWLVKVYAKDGPSVKGHYSASVSNPTGSL